MRFIRTLIVGFTATLGLGAAAGAPAQGAPAPLCTPSSLNTSAQQEGSVTVSPQPGSRDATPRTQISFLGVPAGEIGHVRVTGSRSGAHGGRLLAYSQGDGASFVPAKPFLEGERVRVSALLSAGGAEHALHDEFAIAQTDPLTTTPESIHPGRGSEQQYFHSRPELHPPVLAVTKSSPAVAPGDEFVAPYSGPGQAGPMILGPGGELVWFKALPAHVSATNLQVQHYLGEPVLTWWQGDITVHGFGLGEDVIDDQSYTQIAHVRAGNGLRADLHDFQLTPQGTALITAFEPIRCDLAAVGGPAAGAVTDSVLQEIDVRTGLVMFQWTSLGHVGLGESYEPAARSSTSAPYDYFHINSISLDPDGSLLISARNTWTVYNLSAATGQVEWRLGGKQSSFSMGPGTATAWQHDPQELADGAISVFDNGASPPVHSQSRGIIVELNAQQRTATLLEQIFHSPPLLAESQGDVQALPNGDWFVGWGQLADFSEYNAAGEMLFDAHFPRWTQSYRDFRFPWTGLPAHPPAFALQIGAGGVPTVYASWNGATGISAWRVLAGTDASELVPIAQVPRAGFETAITLTPEQLEPFMTVQALGPEGQVLASARVLDTEAGS